MPTSLELLRQLQQQQQAEERAEVAKPVKKSSVYVAPQAEIDAWNSKFKRQQDVAKALKGQ